VLSFRNHVESRGSLGLPKHARVVFFHGQGDPWDPPILKRHRWVKDNWR
jgi:hypothetical protein